MPFSLDTQSLCYKGTSRFECTKLFFNLKKKNFCRFFRFDSRILPHGAGQDIQYCPVTQFLGQLLRLLVCPNEKFGAQIQKHVKELVGHEMSPALYPILFEQIKVIVEKFFDGSGQVSVCYFFSIRTVKINLNSSSIILLMKILTKNLA